MKKNSVLAIASIVAFIAFFLSPLFVTSVSAQPLPQLPPLPTFNVIPNFTGTWTLGLPGGRMVDENGARQDFQYVELTVNMTGGGGGSDGSRSFGGDIVGHPGAFFNISYNPATPKHYDMYLYLPEPSIGSGNQYFIQVNIRLFVSSNNGDFLYGMMSAAFYDNLSGSSVPKILYHGDAFFSRYGARG